VALASCCLETHALLGLLEVAPVGRNVLDSALDIDVPDYEDGVLHEAARAAGATVIVTTSPTLRSRRWTRSSSWWRRRQRKR